MTVGAAYLSQTAADTVLEEGLVRRCKSGDVAAFESLVQMYQGRVIGFVRRMLDDADEADDVAQEVFVKAFKSIRNFDGRASVATWIFKIASNLCIDRARKKSRRPETLPLALDGSSFEPAGGVDPFSLTAAGQMEEAIENAVAEMSEKLRSVLLLHDLEGLSYEQIAQAMALPIGTVKSRLFLARAHLQAALKPFTTAGEA